MASDEVRRCARCGQAAAVCIRDWKSVRLGMATGSSTRDFCCQHCGHRFTLTQIPQIVAFAILTVLFAITLIGGAIFGALTAYLVWPYVRNPVAPGAPMPPLRFRAVEPLRKCASCSGRASCKAVTRHTVNLVPTGTTWDYACTACAKTFRLRSVGRMAALALGGTFCFVIGILTVAVGLGVIFLLATLVYWGVLAWSIVTELRHPVLAEA